MSARIVVALTLAFSAQASALYSDTTPLAQTWLSRKVKIILDEDGSRTVGQLKKRYAEKGFAHFSQLRRMGDRSLLEFGRFIDQITMDSRVPLALARDLPDSEPLSNLALSARVTETLRAMRVRTLGHLRSAWETKGVAFLQSSPRLRTVEAKAQLGILLPGSDNAAIPLAQVWTLPDDTEVAKLDLKDEYRRNLRARSIESVGELRRAYCQIGAAVFGRPGADWTPIQVPPPERDNFGVIPLDRAPAMPDGVELVYLSINARTRDFLYDEKLSTVGDLRRHFARYGLTQLAHQPQFGSAKLKEVRTVLGLERCSDLIAF